MARKNMTKEEEKRLRELNKACQECMRLVQENCVSMDFKKCMTCEIGDEVHKLDPDSVDGHNSGRYERYFTA